MPIDFSKIFSQNAPSTPFVWTDPEYLQGWDVIQNTPPTRQQFNALQMISDEKDLELYNTKAPKHSPIFTGDPQAPTPDWSDDDTSIATTEFVQHLIQANGAGIIASSLGQNGYVKFKNGWMVQWGSTTSSPLILPTAFPQDTWVINSTHVTYLDRPCFVVFDGSNKTSSSIKYAVYDAMSDSWDVGNVIYYIAVGR